MSRFPEEPNDVADWERYLRRALNTLYQCRAVRDVRCKSRGQHANHWEATLFPDNPPEWTNIHTHELEQIINDARTRAGRDSVVELTVKGPST